MHIGDLRQRLRALAALPVHEDRVLRRWAMAQPQEGGRKQLQHFLPQALRAELASITDELAGLVRLHSQHPGEDGSARLLVTLRDGQQIESVLLPPDRPKRRPSQAAAGGGLCVSTQVGCAVGCVFCMTGQGGLVRQLGSAEIVAQVVLARGLRPVNKVVFMGMGEPAHNLDAVMEAIALLGTGGGIGHKNLVFSTVGDPRVFERLHALGPGEVKPALALSLHSTFADKRAELLPRAPRFDPAELVEAGERYARSSGYPIQFQWTLIEGVNDGDDEIEGIVRLLSGKYALMNMIPYNAVDGLAFRRPSWARAAEIARLLHRRGILTKLRQSAGQDVDAGCGQLRARAAAPAGRRIPIVAAGTAGTASA
ncbi:MAG: RNA methyltransferase [Rubrivivax sp.]|nr:RNA methyltransferase [Rubrivivax sp.]